MDAKIKRIMNLLGMAQRARRLASGAFAAQQAVQEGQAVFLLIAADAEEESKRRYKSLAEEANIPCAEGLTRETLGRAIGKEYRAAAALLDEGFAKKLRSLLESGEQEHEEQAE